MFKEYIKELSDNGSIIIFSSHRMEHVELFCKKLVILKDGKSVLKGNVKEIKENFRKKNIIVSGDIDISKIKKIPGVLEVVKNPLDIVIKIKDESVSPMVFEVVSKSKNITKYSLEEPTLNEIFVAKVGESYEK
jgi:ABC-2 type transport system ATP-binding protein